MISRYEPHDFSVVKKSFRALQAEGESERLRMFKFQVQSMS